MSANSNPFPALPPPPDPETGEPFPPPGLGYRGHDDGQPELDPDRDTRLRYKPTPPPGRGDVLGWYREGILGHLRLAAIVFVVVCVGTTLIFVYHGDPALEWATYWQIWLAIIVGTTASARPVTRRTYAAGADWIAIQVHRYGYLVRTQVADSYGLTKIKLDPRFYGMYLVLQDETTKLAVPLNDLQGDRRVWDLLYNGILHSVAGGAKVNRAATKWLEFDQIPALQNLIAPRHEGSLTSDDYRPADGEQPTSATDCVEPADTAECPLLANEPHADDPDAGTAYGEAPSAPDNTEGDDAEGDDAEERKGDQPPENPNRAGGGDRGDTGRTPEWVRRVR